MNKILLEEKKLNRLVKKTVAETFFGVLQDPDLGLELQAWAKKRLSKRPKGVVSLAELRKRYF